MNELKCRSFEENSGLSPQISCFILADKKLDKLLAMSVLFLSGLLYQGMENALL